MPNFSIKWKNFRGFKDTGWIEIKPITIVIGANASGKTSLIAPLRLLKQTLEASDTELPLKAKGELFNVGSWKDLIFSHKEEQELSFALRFMHGKRDKEKKLRKLGDYPPDEIEIFFKSKRGSSAPYLSRYVIRDFYGRIMLDRRRLKNGQYSVLGISREIAKKGFGAAIRESKPEGFLFTADEPFRMNVTEQRKKAGKGQSLKKSDIRVRIGQSEGLYISTVIFANEDIRKLLGRISYLGPLSEHPLRLYELSGEIPRNVGTKGEYAPEILFRRRRSNLLDKVDKWISKFEFGLHINCNELTDDSFNITLSRTKSSPKVNLADSGFGLSQVLPLLVQGFYASPRSMIIAEQPEIHLNPRLQSLLADLLCDFASRRVGVLVETHSEHLLLRLRRLVAENKIKANDIALYYVEKTNDESRVREIPVKQNGHVEPLEWPKGFFEESLRESLGLALAQLGVKKRVN